MKSISKLHNETTMNVKQSFKPYFEHGFWHWYDPVRKGWYVGTAPQIQKPSWAK